MLIPKWYWEKIIEQQDELNRRVKRLELMFLKDAETKIASLRDEKAGTVSQDGVLTIEETINRTIRNKKA